MPFQTLINCLPFLFLSIGVIVQIYPMETQQQILDGKINGLEKQILQGKINALEEQIQEMANAKTQQQILDDKILEDQEAMANAMETQQQIFDDKINALEEQILQDQKAMTQQILDCKINAPEKQILKMANAMETQQQIFDDKINALEKQILEMANAMETQQQIFDDKINTLEDQKANLVPIGSILSFVFIESLFARIVGDPAVFNPKTSKWAFADGRNVVGSKYSNLISNKTLLDLRGMFLRGLNLGRADDLRDPDGNREIGSVQLDTLQNHTHILENDGAPGIWDSGCGSGPLHRASSASYKNKPVFLVFGVSEKFGEEVVRASSETRPKNVAVYYYIKIN